MTMATPIAPAALANAVDGRVWLPADPGYEQEVFGFNAAVRHRPDVVVGAACAADVAAAVRYAAADGLRVTVQATGHGASAPVIGGVMITTGRMQEVEIDPASRTATVAAGVRWGAVLEAAAVHGLTAVTGSAPSVGVVGLVLGGGVGPLSRTLGFASDRLRAVQLVTADGAIREIDHERDPELFWALRGGKRGFGIVTAVTIDLVELDELYGGALWFGAEDAPRLLAAWATWSRDLPESITTSAAMLRLPPLPELPEFLRGRFVLQVRVAAIDDDERARLLVDELRGLAPRLLDTVGRMPAKAVGDIHGDPSEPMPVWEAGCLLREFDEAAASTLLAIAGPDQEVPLAAVEIRRCGGRLHRAPAEGDAVGGRDAEYSLFIVGAPVPELLDTVIPAVGGAVVAALTPWATGRTQANFHGVITETNPESRAWPEAVYQRIVEVRRRVDPQGVFG